ncbi:conjugal transfer protein TraH [Pseudomonas sp. LS-2]|uniref:conjugal transfer protein TraH n=1 Tax=Pseudomonas sp. LS-2 TaxID=2315859 RepID=UPI000E70CF4B|nr:conjugal transfer protein TraH [Pseudomonas sp. LS-2]RJX72663.1 conjugal transfer protein TraH [Pseudomonas sp. LS-2]
MRLNSNTLLLAGLLSLAPLGAHADIQSQLDSMFDSMSNTTDAGAYETATRGVITGGSLRVRNKISTTPIINFKPPSFQAGCGGIDMFAGSFSFINAQQFVQALRSVASNAVGVASGYAFKLALNAMGPTVHNVIQNLQEVMQDINSLMSNSCQLAQGLVTDAFSSFVSKDTMRAANINVSQGIGDAFSSIMPGSLTSKSPKEQQSDSGLAKSCEDIGNVLWCAMEQYGAQSFFTYGSRQTDEIIMSFTGTVLIKALTDAEDGKGKVPETQYFGPTGITLQDIVEGKKDETVSIYDCSSDEAACMELKSQNIAFDGLGEKIVKAFNGNSNSPGIVYKWASNTGSFTADEVSVISALQKAGFSAMIQRIAQRSESMAKGFVSAHAKMLALEGAYSLTSSYINTAEAVLQRGKMVDQLGEKSREFIVDARDRLTAEHLALQAKYGNDNDMYKDWTVRMQVIPPPNFITTMGNHPVRAQ